MTASLMLALLLQVELRWVDQAAPPLGVLSSAGQPGALSTLGSGVQSLGPALRVASGEAAQWTLQLHSVPLWVQPTRGPWRATTRVDGGDALWLFEARPQWQGEGKPLRLQLRWQQPLPEGGSQSWQSSLPVAEGRWATVAREAPPAALPDGILRTQATPRVRELQVRVTRIPE
jgi:hypothetical protein